ncbi:MAG TPA: EamA family transporter [Verrucomicrobiae bacterium]|nr:EamA family transporter [Verrucomicrobiae bacterium]
MIKILLILLFGLTCESTGVILLKKGMTHIGDINGYTVAEMFRVFKAGVTSPQILLGVFFEAVFFGCLLLLMNKSDISFLWPLTALSFVFATLAAMIFLGESVSWIRWIGVALIMLGAAFISYSEHAKEKSAPPTATQTPITEK